MKRILTLKTIVIFGLECAIPIVSTIFLPGLFPGSSSMEICIAAMCISIFIAAWDIKFILQNDSRELKQHSSSSKNEFSNLNRSVDVLGRLLRFQKKVDQVSHPFFQKIVNEKLEICLADFEDKNADLFEGYIETNPYETHTFGVNGLQWTKKEIHAVSGIGDYWDREDFANRYLEAQFDLIRAKKVTVERIFIVSNDTFKKMEPLMTYQKENGVRVFYLNKDGKYFSPEWDGQDFMIQDGELLADLQAQSHRPGTQAKEIISTKVQLVEEKKLIYEQMFNSSTPF